MSIVNSNPELSELQWTSSKLSAAVRSARWPLIGWIVLTASGVMLLESLHSLQLVKTLFFSLLILLHISLLWHFEELAERMPAFYFLIQSLLICVAALLLPNGSPIILIGLFPVLIGQMMAVTHRKLWLVLAIGYILTLFCVTVDKTGGSHLLSLLLPLFVLMSVVVGTISHMALRQVNAQLRTQKFLVELQDAHRRVEELTVAQERQRMARDLHDTLAQDLAALIMQLEAVDAHMAAERHGRAREIIRQAMERARRTMAEARTVIDDLRSVAMANYDFGETLEAFIGDFSNHSGIPVHLHLNPQVRLSKLLSEHTLGIVRESLYNTAKHTKAGQIWVWIDRVRGNIRIEICDNGDGFDTEEIGKKAGHYGLIGIRERVRIMGGSMEISSGPDGTVIRVDVPLNEREDVEDDEG